MSNFITNEKGNELKKRIIELVKNSKELKFLVGFFYFSGIRELYKGLKENIIICEVNCSLEALVLLRGSLNS